MLRKLLWLLPLCITTQVAFACDDKVVEDAEPNWSTAKYSCPLSIKTENEEHKFISYSAASGMNENGLWYILKPVSRKHIQHEFMLSKEQAYIFCRYGGLDTEIIIHAKDAIACGGKGVCWTTDPYAGKKKSP